MISGGERDNPFQSPAIKTAGVEENAMKKKLIWAGVISSACILVILIGLSLIVKSYLRSDKLRSIIIPKVEELTGRRATIDTIRVSILSGIIVQGIGLKELDGKTDFIKAREFVLDYSLMPLLKKQLVIKKIEVISPYIHLERDRNNRYNFSDIAGKEKRGSPEPDSGKEIGFPLSIITDRIVIRDAQLEFSDEKKEIPGIFVKSDIDLKVSADKGLSNLAISGDADLKELKVNIKGLQTNTSGKIRFDRSSIQINLVTTMDKDSVKLSGSVKDYLTSPDIRLNLYSHELSIGKLASAGSGGKAGTEAKEVPGKTTRGKEKTGGLRASGEIRIDTAGFESYSIKDFLINYHYANGIMTIEPLSLKFAGGEGIHAEGVLKGDLQFQGDTSEDIKKSLTGKGTVELSSCEVKRSQITDAIALFTGIEDLKTPKFDSVRFRFTTRERKIYLDGNMTARQFSLNPSGTVTFDKRIDITTDLRLSPLLASKLGTQSITQYIKDDKGWSVIPLKISGTMEKPSVGLNPAAVRKGIEKGIKDEMGKRILKGIFGK